MKSKGSSRTASVPSFQGFFEAVAQTAVAVFFESFERERWASDISTHALESRSVATIDGDPGPRSHRSELLSGWLYVPNELSVVTVAELAACTQRSR